MQLQSLVITHIIPSPDTFVCLCGSELPSCATFFQSEELLLVPLVRPVCQQLTVFCLGILVFHSHSLKILLLDTRLSVGRFFLSTLNTSALCHLVFSVSKSAVKFIGVLLFLMSCFSPAVFKSLSLSLIFQLACVLVRVFVFILLGILSFLDMKLIFFIRFGKFPAIIFSSIFSIPILYSRCMYVGELNGILNFIETLFISLHFFPVYSLNRVISIDQA